MLNVSTMLAKHFQAANTMRRLLSCSAIVRKDMIDPMELLTGRQRQEEEARLAGADDPYMLKGMKRGPGTKDNPNLVPSAFDERIVGCVCNKDDLHIKYMRLFKGYPQRCYCGYWFELVYRPLIYS